MMVTQRALSPGFPSQAAQVIETAENRFTFDTIPFSFIKEGIAFELASDNPERQKGVTQTMDSKTFAKQLASI